MRGFILGASLVAAIVVLVAAGMTTTTELPALKDLPLAHAFNARFEVQPGKPLVFTMPGSVGFAFTHFVEESGSQQQYEVLINGLLVRRGSAPYIGIGGYCSTTTILPA